MKMKMSKTSIIPFIACLILLVSLTSVFALTEDFSAVSGKILYVGECSTVVSKVLVKNTGAITSSYTVSVEGNAANWVSYAPSSFILKPTEVEEVFVYLKAPCKSEGKYSLETYIRTRLGVEKVLNQEIKVHETQNIEVAPVVYSASIDPCETAIFDFDIKNTGDFPETYEFKAEPFSKNTVFSRNNITIKSQETERIRMYTTPACDVWGDYSLNLITDAKLSRTTAETEGIQLQINRNYDFSLTFGALYVPMANETPTIDSHEGAYTLCEYDYGAIPVLIENDAKIANTYYFDLEGKEWTSLSGNTVTLAPGQSAYVNINIAPPKPMRDNSTITLTVESVLGEIEKSEARDIVVDICNMPVITEKTTKVKTYYEESFANLTLLNIGSQTTNYALSVEGADWISLVPSELELAPGEQGNFYLHMQPTNATPEGKHYLTLNAATDSRQYQKEISVSIKEPRFSNMILDEYLLFTILFLVLLVLCSIGTVVFAVYLDKTKDQRAKAAEQTSKAKEKRRLEKEKAREKRRLEKERLRLARQQEKEKRRLARLKARENKKLEKEKKKTSKHDARITSGKKVSAKPKTGFNWKKWILWTIVFIVTAVIVFFAVKALFNLGIYKTYLITGAIVLAAIVILLVIGEFILSKWYKEQVWKTLVPNQKGVLILTWSKGLGEIVIRLKGTFGNARMKVKRHFWKPTFLSAGERVYQYFEIKKVNFENKDIEKVSFRFRVRKSWLTRHNIPQRTVKLTRYNNEQWTGISTEVIRDGKKYVYYEAVSSSCSLFAILGKPKPKKEENQEKPKKEKPKVKIVEKKVAVEKRVKAKPRKKKAKKDWSNELRIAGFVVLALVILGLIGYGVYYTVTHAPVDDNTTIDVNDTVVDNVTVDVNDTVVDNLTIGDNITVDVNETSNETVGDDDEELEGGIPSQEWDEDTEHILRLSDYFQDPDNDVLAYTHTPLEHIIISIDDEGTATLTPEKNWHGTESVVFTADDSKGGIVSSNEVKLTVKDVEEPPFMERLKQGFSTYSNYVMIGVLILVILILLIEFRKPIMKFLEED